MTLSTAIAGLVLLLLFSSADAFVVPRKESDTRSRRSLIHMVASKTDFGALTVKELKELIKEGPIPVQRGLLSKLKKKQDFIDYLERRENGQLPSEPAPNKMANKSVPLKMPALATPTTNKTQLTSKERIFEQVFERYPPLRQQYQEEQADSNTTPIDDVRQIYHPIFRHQRHGNGCDMDLVFVGTASCTPGTTRGVSCTALRLNWRRRAAFQKPTLPNLNAPNNNSAFQGGTWLFDVGECTQLQVQRTNSIRPSKITKIFLTHAHGDHTFGLPGLLCLMGQDRDRTANDTVVVDIYGPEGLRKWLRVAIRYSVSRIVPPYRVHELKDIPMAPEWEFSPRMHRYYYKGLNNNNRGPRSWGTLGLSGEDPNSWISQAEGIRLEPSSLYGEVPGGRDIYPDYGHPLANNDAPVWEVEDEDDVRVYAAPMSHGIPCVGYVVQESSRPGRLRNELVEPLVQRNLEALKNSGFRIPLKAMAVIKNLPLGSTFTFPDGTTITQEEAVEPPRKGRKVVICGDTANCRALEVLAKDCDVLVHEATNAYLPGVDQNTDLRTVTRDAIIHGHSTPEIAGLFAKKVNAQRLLLNHFSARYKGDPSAASISIMTRMEQFAMAASGLNEFNVAAAWDFMVLPIPSSSTVEEE